MTVLDVVHGRFVFGRRVRVLSEHLAARLPPHARVLDVGCGDGTISRLILDRRSDLHIEGIDVFKRPNTAIHVQIFDGRTIPFPDKAFDTVMFVDVLHHTDDPLVLLREAKRVASQTIVLKDHARDGVLAGATLRLMDWVGNARHGVVLPYNYWTTPQWHEAFRSLDLRIESWETALRIYPPPASWLFDRSLHFIAAARPAHAPSPPLRRL